MTQLWLESGQETKPERESTFLVFQLQEANWSQWLIYTSWRLRG